MEGVAAHRKELGGVCQTCHKANSEKTETGFAIRKGMADVVRCVFDDGGERNRDAAVSFKRQLHFLARLHLAFQLRQSDEHRAGLELRRSVGGHGDRRHRLVADDSSILAAASDFADTM